MTQEQAREFCEFGEEPLASYCRRHGCSYEGVPLSWALEEAARLLSIAESPERWWISPYYYEDERGIAERSAARRFIEKYRRLV